MDIRIFLYDGSFEGLLTAVALAVKEVSPVQEIRETKHFQPSLFTTPFTVTSEREQAERLLSYIKGLSADVMHMTINSFLSEKEVGTDLLAFITLSLKYGSQAYNMYSHDAVRKLRQLSTKVDQEAHRLTGLLRFRRLRTGQYYAPFSADHHVIFYLAQHFLQRFPHNQWLLHDIRRDIALFWDNQELQQADVAAALTRHVKLHGEVPDNQLSSEEETYQNMWRIFHTQTANEERTNTRLQRHLMPQRYWHFMVEMQVKKDTFQEKMRVQARGR